MVGWAALQDMPIYMKYGSNRTHKLTLWAALKRLLRKNHTIEKEKLIRSLTKRQDYTTYAYWNRRSRSSVEWYLGKLKNAGYIDYAHGRVCLKKLIPANLKVRDVKYIKPNDFFTEEEFEI